MGTTTQPGCTEPCRKPSSSSMPCAAVPPRNAAVGPAWPSRHGNAAGRSYRCKHRLGAAGHLASGAGDHHADRVEQMPPRIMAHLFGQRAMAQLKDETKDGFARPCGRMKRKNCFGMRCVGMGHGRLIGIRSGLAFYTSRGLTAAGCAGGQSHHRVDCDDACALWAHDEWIDLRLRDAGIVREP